MLLNKKLLLISASFEDISLINASKHNPKGIKTEDTSHYPLGFAYLHSYLEPRGYELKSLFLNNHVYEECFNQVKRVITEFNPSLVGLQIFTANRNASFRLIEYIHENLPDIKIVIGGIHTTIMHDQILNKYPYLTAVLGEGEITFSELLHELERDNPDLNKINGIAFNDKGRVVKTPDRELIANLDELPFPKHEEFFRDVKRKNGCIMTSRGCPFACSFCCLDAISRRRVRLRSPKNVVDEVEMMTRKLPQIKRIWVQDDNFFIDNDRVIAICDEIIKRGIKINFICSGRMKPISREMIKKLEQAGFKKVLLGLESGDPEVLKKCHKAITPEDAVNAVKLFAESSVEIGIFLIVGLPGETPKTILNTARLVQKLQKIKYFVCGDASIIAVYPGTEVWRIFSGTGKINDDYWLSEKPVPLYTGEHSPEKLFAMQKILISHVSLLSFLTPVGLRYQFVMIPTILKYLIKHKKMLIYMISRSIKLYLPANIHNTMKNIYYKFTGSW